MNRNLAFACALWLLGSLSLRAADVLPVTGSWVNLFYQDQRNQYSNPAGVDCTDPALWHAKMCEMHSMGIEYAVIMAVANEGKACYPSQLMPHAYTHQQSPVDAILQAADSLGMKVFLSIGWAKDQDDNLRNKATLRRQLQIMGELAKIYGNRTSFYGWYLPVEDCLGPVLSDHAVVAVNKLVERAHSITPGKKTLISPYGFFRCNFSDPRFAKQIERLKVDIIAYQDEVGCVRESYPMPRLKQAWKHMKAIHNRTGIEFWANCELFTWTAGTNSRSSALVPAAMPRVLSQLVAASQGGVSRIISFMTCGIWDLGTKGFALGDPLTARSAAENYMAWLNGDPLLHTLEQSMCGTLANLLPCNSAQPLTDGVTADEDPSNKAWQRFDAGTHRITLDAQPGADRIFLRLLNSEKSQLHLPEKIVLRATLPNGETSVIDTATPQPYPYSRHDTWIEGIMLHLGASDTCSEANQPTTWVIELHSSKPFAIDEIYALPR